MMCEKCDRFHDCGTVLMLNLMKCVEPEADISVNCKSFKPRTINRVVNQYKGEQKISDYFVEESYKIEDPAEVLNWYRNLYYKEADNTERGVMARALNKVLIELVELRRFKNRILEVVGDRNDGQEKM